MSSIFAQLPNRLIMDIIKIRLDDEYAEVEAKRIEKETLFYWINRMSPKAVTGLRASMCKRIKKQILVENPQLQGNQLYRRVVDTAGDSYNQYRKEHIMKHIKRIKKEGYDMDSLYSDQAFYALRHQSNNFYCLTNATLNRRDNQ
jgi:hypothetical protein